MVPRVGQRIGPYEILGRLGSGGMGLVFSAWDARLQRDVAIKLLREEYATPTMRTRFLQEARAASGLNHPNICTVFDIGEVSGEPFLVMELLKGETLRARITRDGKLSPEDVCRVATEVLDALVVAHGRGVIHRDIKPANIILVNKPTGGFQAKVLDFGLAKIEMAEDESTQSDLTTIGTTVGTVSYMSPEQAKGESIDARSDLFSLGSVLYEALTGELPFQGATSALIFVELLGKPPAPIRSHNPAVPKDLDKIITRLLAKNRSDRFQSASSVLLALQTVSFRKSPLEGLSLWGSKSNAAKAGADTSAGMPPGESPGADPAPRSFDSPNSPAPPKSSADTGTVLRPARRVLHETLSPRPANSPVLPSSSPAPDRIVSQEPLGSPLPPAKPAPAMGAVTVRPVKPEPARSPGEARTPASSAEAHLDTTPAHRSALLTSTPASSPASGTPSDISAPISANGAGALGAWNGQETQPQPAQRVVLSRPTGPPQEEPLTLLAAAETREGSGPSRGKRRIWLVAAAAVPLLVGGLTWYFSSHRETAATKGPIAVVLAGLQNSTGDSALSGVLSTGLEIALKQSPHLIVRSGEQYQSGLQSIGRGSGDVSMGQAREAAYAIGAKELVFGDIHPEGTAYVLALRLYDAATGTRTAELSESAASREQIADAIDRLASDLRSALSETGDMIGRNGIPLSKEATSNVDALAAYASGASLEAAGNTGEAMLAYQRALNAEPHFTQAYLRLAELYGEQHAETASASAATEARTNSAAASARTQELAQASFAIHAAGDYGRASEVLNRLLALYPADLAGLDALTLAQFKAGKFSDAQATAEHVLHLFRFDRQATTQEELSLIALGRPEAVASVEAQGEAATLSRRGIATLALAASAGRNQMFLPDADRPLPPALAAGLLEAAGHFTDATARWQALLETAHSAPGMISAASYADGVSALNHALAADCDAALPLAQQVQALPAGPSATFSAGEAQALCGNLDGARTSLATLNAGFDRGSAAQDYLVPDLAATIAWRAGDAPGALRILDAARQFDTISLTAYLRGLVEIADKQPQLGIVQFQAILSHKGPTMLFNPEVYPLAQLGLGRAYAASGDTANTSAAYARFLELWNTADPNIGAVNEAKAHSR